MSNDTSIRNTSSLQRFANISDVSKCFRLNFWQHYTFEYYARHVLFKWTLDINDKKQYYSTSPDNDLKPQVIGYVGGSAGTGKSEVISALLKFATLWGRRDSIETMAFMNLAAINVDGETIHASRAIAVFRQQSMNATRKAKINNIYLSIIDEASMIPQDLLGKAELRTREVKHNDQVWGGIHILFTGDPLQLPPVAGPHFFKPLADKTNDFNSTAAYKIWTSVNWTACLTNIWRQRNDKQFEEILERMHWGVNTQEDLNICNTRTIDKVRTNETLLQQRSADYFAPMVTALNDDRVAYGKQQTFDYAVKHKVTLFQIVAESIGNKHVALIKRFSYLSDECTSKIPLCLTYHFGMPIMITQKLEELLILKACTRGTIGNIVGHVAHNPQETDDTMFHISDIPVGSESVQVKRFKKLPQFLLIKIIGCNRILVRGYPVGVVGIPVWEGSCELTLPGLKKISPKLKQFPMINANAMTPEKSQGLTAYDDFSISANLDRKGYKPQTGYVVWSRVRSLQQIFLNEEITMFYIRKFRPPHFILNIMKQILDQIVLPTYIPPTELAHFEKWKTTQMLYYTQSISMRNNRVNESNQLTTQNRNKQNSIHTRSAAEVLRIATLAATRTSAIETARKAAAIIRARRAAEEAVAQTAILRGNAVLQLCDYTDNGHTFDLEDIALHASLSNVEDSNIEDAEEVYRCFYIHIGTLYFCKIIFL